MQEYQKQPCIVCGELFNKDADIVTCPECGTPYHRACWQKEGQCINLQLHQSGESWMVQRKRELDAERAAARRAEEAEQAAARERGEGPQTFDAGIYDGVRLDSDDPCLGMDPEEQLGNATIRETAEFVGTNRFYYLPMFRLMKRTGKKLSFNFLSLLFPHIYFANRKMWGLALTSLIVRVLLDVPSAIKMMNDSFQITVPWANIETAGFQTVSKLCTVLYVVFALLWGLGANYFYYRFTQRKINGLRKTAGSKEELYAKLKSEGGTSLTNVVLIILQQLCFSFALAFVLMYVR